MLHFSAPTMRWWLATALSFTIFRCCVRKDKADRARIYGEGKVGLKPINTRDCPQSVHPSIIAIHTEINKGNYRFAEAAAATRHHYQQRALNLFDQIKLWLDRNDNNLYSIDGTDEEGYIQIRLRWNEGSKVEVIGIDIAE